MKKLSTPLVISILLATVASIFFFNYSEKSIDSEKISINRKKLSNIINLYQNELNNKAIFQQNIIDFVNKSSLLLKEYVLISTFDINGAVISSKIETRYSSNTKLTDSILNDFKNSQLYPKNGGLFSIKSYDGQEYVFFTLKFNFGKMLIVFSNDTPAKIITRKILELIIICSIITAIVFFLYSMTYRSKITKNIPAASQLKESLPKSPNTAPPIKSVGINQNYSKPYENGYENKPKNIDLEDFFNHLYSKHSIGSASLFLYDDSAGLIIKGEKVFKNTQVSRGTIQDGIINELRNNSTIIQKNGLHVIVPLFENNTLVAILSIIRENRFTGIEIEEIKKSMQTNLF